MRCDRRKRQYYDPLLGDIDMATLMEDVDSESGSQNGLQGVNIEDLAHAKEGSMATRERPGTPREAHSSCSRPDCLYLHSGSICACARNLFNPGD